MEYCFFMSLITVTVLVTGGLEQAAGVYMVLGNEIISEHSLVNLHDIGNTAETGLRCVTERVDCCSGDNGTRAEWFDPRNRTASVVFFRSRNGVGSAKGYVNLYQRNLGGGSDHAKSGIYHCNIPAPSPSDDVSTLYVGIYKNSDEGIPIITSITYDQISSEIFTLTCISTGGPATNVTWTLNGSVIANHVLTQTVVDTTTAEYNNTLTVTGREAGSYQCNVSNARGSDTSQLLVLNFTEQPVSSSRLMSSSITPTPLSTPPTDMSMARIIVVSAVAAVLLVVTVMLSIVIVLLVLRLRHGSGVIQIDPTYINLSDSRAAAEEPDPTYSHLDHKTTATVQDPTYSHRDHRTATVKQDPTCSHFHHRLSAEGQTTALDDEYDHLDCKTAPASVDYSYIKLDHEALTETQDPTSSRGTGEGSERGGKGAIYSEPSMPYEMGVDYEQPVVGKTVLSYATEETVV